MPRRKPRPQRRAEPSPVFGDALRRVEEGPDGMPFVVRTVPGSRAAKIYRCPGCDHEVRPGVAHVVVWPAEDTGGAGDRRHWHTGCWNGRQTRRVTRRWS